MPVIRWNSPHGLEHLAFNSRADTIEADGTVIGADEGIDFALTYRLQIASDWTARSIDVTVAGGSSLTLTTNGQGAWADTGGHPLASLSGCIDLDLSATPFTNTLPIRRLGLAAGERRIVRVVYITAPTLAVSVAEQAYTCLHPMRRYRFESLGTDFHAEIEVDRDGLVVDYPGLFTRIL